MAGLPEELEFELEALRATYGDDLVDVQQGDAAAAPAAAVVAVPVAPRTDGGAEHESFVAGRLVMAVGPSYPDAPPEVHLADAKGLGDQRLAQLQAALAAEAASLAGELQLGHLCETAIDLLTPANQPEGDCAFCLEPLLPAAGGRGAAAGHVLRLGCYHCYHMGCFANWWQWQQRRTAEREAQLRAEYKSMAPLKLQEEGIRREAVAPCDGDGSSDSGGGEAYVLSCPACRCDVAPCSLAHAWRQMQQSSADSWSGAGGGGRAALQALPPQQREALKAMQQRHAAVMRRQQACGGLVDATHSVSISDLQHAAAAAAAAEAAVAAEAATAAAGAGEQRAQQARANGRGSRGRGHGPPPGFGGGGGSDGGPRDGRGRGGRHQGGSRRGGGRGRDGSGHQAPPQAAPSAALAGLTLNGSQQQQQQQQQHKPGGRGRAGGRGRGGGARPPAAPPAANGSS